MGGRLGKDLMSTTSLAFRPWGSGVAELMLTPVFDLLRPVAMWELGRETVSQLVPGVFVFPGPKDGGTEETMTPVFLLYPRSWRGLGIECYLIWFWPLFASRDGGTDEDLSPVNRLCPRKSGRGLKFLCHLPYEWPLPVQDGHSAAYSLSPVYRLPVPTSWCELILDCHLIAICSHHTVSSWAGKLDYSWCLNVCCFPTLGWGTAASQLAPCRVLLCPSLKGGIDGTDVCRIDEAV